jgi:hypothetical protein
VQALWAERGLNTDEPAGGPRDVERYEQLLAQALDGDPSGWRLGLALLQRRGVVAWTRPWQTTTPLPAPGSLRHARRGQRAFRRRADTVHRNGLVARS